MAEEVEEVGEKRKGWELAREVREERDRWTIRR